MSQPKDAPPSYATATGSSTTSKPANTSLQVPGSQHDIPSANRRSMEDESRPLPDGWVRQWDAKEQHQFFVDTKADPPRSIWHHPYDDDQYLNSLSSERREQLQEDEHRRREYGAAADHKAASPVTAHTTGSSSHFPEELPARPGHDRKNSSAKPGLGERLKEKVTGKTKEERELERRKREEEERQYYEAHAKFRQAMQQAQMTGQPAYLGKNREGQDIYIEPPNAASMGYGSYGANGYAYNPYTSGPYASPNARFVRPSYPYNRPYGGGYGGGYGMPLAGGMLGGMLLGGLLF